MSKQQRRRLVAGLLLVLSAAIMVGCSQPATVSGAARTPVATPTSGVFTSGSTSQLVMIPENDIFSPYILVMNAGDRVTWVNDDSMAHSVVTAPRAGGGVLDPELFQLVLAPTQQGSITLRQPGLYYYYCAVHAALTPQGRAAAFASVRPYPVAMDGFLYVRGPGLSGLSAATVTFSANNQFTPWVTVLNSGAALTWINQTQQPQDVRSSPGYGAVNPVPISVHLAAGASQSMTFTTPGVYDYYASGSATVDPSWQRPVARPGVAGFPVPAEGIVVVLG